MAVGQKKYPHIFSNFDRFTKYVYFYTEKMCVLNILRTNIVLRGVVQLLWKRKEFNVFTHLKIRT